MRVNDLDKLTLYYWRVSKAFYGKSDEVISFEKAARCLGAVLYGAGTTHKVSTQAFNLRKELIRGSSPKPIEGENMTNPLSTLK